MSMAHGALMTTMAYYLMGSLDSMFSFQTLTRPLCMAWIVGLFLGDMHTGIVMGGLLEAVFMGVSGIGGSIPAQPATSAAFSTALVILSKGEIDMATSVAMAMPFGTLMTSINNVVRPVYVLFEPLFEKWAEEGKYKPYLTFHILFSFTVSRIFFTVVTYFAVLFGAEYATDLIAWIPKPVMNGIQASGNMLAVVGFGILTAMLWSESRHLLWLVLGFLIANYLKLPMLATGGFGFIIAIVILMRDIDIHALRLAGPIGEKDEMEDFLDG